MLSEEEEEEPGCRYGEGRRSSQLSAAVIAGTCGFPRVLGESRCALACEAPRRVCWRGVRGVDSCNVTEVPPEQRRELAGHGRYGPSEGGKINGPVTQTGCELSARHARLNTFRQHGAFVSATKGSRFVQAVSFFFFLRQRAKAFFFDHFHSRHQRFRLSCPTGSEEKAGDVALLSAQVKTVNTSEPVRVCVRAISCHAAPCGLVTAAMNQARGDRSYSREEVSAASNQLGLVAASRLMD